ncbi:Lrp/AsnC family transcriptional regulator [Chloroflexota bacterium]
MINNILKILEDDARTTLKQIATMTAQSEQVVSAEIQQAEKDKVILKYKAIVNWDKVEEERVWALIQVQASPQKNVGFDSIARRISQFPIARSVYLVSGSHDLVILASGRSEREIADFVSQKLAPIDGVKGTITNFMLKRYKEDGEILDGTEKVKRQDIVL